MLFVDLDLFIGRFHPVVLHFPIGILLVAVVFEFLPSRFMGEKAPQKIVEFTLLLAGISAIVAIATGLLLAGEGGYDADQLNFHKWMGIGTGVVIWASWLLHRMVRAGKLAVRPFQAALLAGMVAITITGHWGGNLTHGETFLTEHAPFGGGGGSDNPLDNRAKPAMLDTAQVFADVVYPILRAKCQSCHGTSKMKGDLQMHTFAAIHEGGKSGAVVVPGNALQSEMIRRTMLDPEDEKFMPPQGKEPLTEKEISLLTVWIEAGAKDSMVVPMLQDTAKLELVAAHLGFGVGGEATDETALSNLPPLADPSLEDFADGPFRVVPISQKSNALEVLVSDTNDMAVADDLADLMPVKDNIVWLRMGQTDLNDASIDMLLQMPNLRKVWLDGTAVTDAGAAKLAALEHLVYLNLNYVQLSAATLAKLEANEDLRLFNFNPAQ